MAFTVITDTSGNLPKFMADEYGLKVIPFYYHVDGKDLCCEAIEDFDSESYYRRLKDGPRVTTTQITPQRYLEYFEEEAKAGRDFIYVSMSGGISGSCDSARVALRMLAEDYPDVKAFVIDTKGAALGEGFVALEAARLRDRGISIEEAAEKLEDYSKRMCNVFTVDDLLYLKRQLCAVRIVQCQCAAGRFKFGDCSRLCLFQNILKITQLRRICIPV